MLEVGDIVFLLDKKTHVVVPCRVVEKVNSISLQGENTYHMIETPQGKNLKLEEYKSPWFTTIDEARNFLINAAKSLVDATIEKTNATREKYFPEPAAPSFEISENEGDVGNEGYLESLSKDDSLFENNKKRVMVDLGDGQKARVNIPEMPDF